MKDKRKFRSHLLRVVAGTLTTLFVITGLSPAQAAQVCLNTPELSSTHLVESLSLGSGVTAKAWKWSLGDDASNASVSNLGTQVSVVSGNLRKITFGVLHWSLPQTQDLRMLSFSSPTAVASMNGDYFDGDGPWNAMVEEGKNIYSPPTATGVIGLSKHRVYESRGYRSGGTITIGKKKFPITGVNQLSPAASSIVVYKRSYGKDITPKGQVTLIIRNSKVYKVYPKGYAAPKSLGTVIQVRGYYATAFGLAKLRTATKLVLPPAPMYEERITADTLRASGSISSSANTVNFDSVNFKQGNPSGATLFDENFSEVSNAGRVTLRIGKDALGRLIIKNVYRQGYFTKVDSGGYLLQAFGASATAAALKFKAGDLVSVSQNYQSGNGTQFISAGGRGPRIIQGGKIVWICSLHNKDSRPRSAIGWNQDGQIWFMTSSRGENAVDFGVRMGGSTSEQMAHWLYSLGATDAVLLDGGGSTTMEVKQPDQQWRRFDLPDDAWYRDLANAFSIETRN